MFKINYKMFFRGLCYGIVCAALLVYLTRFIADLSQQLLYLQLDVASLRSAILEDNQKHNEELDIRDKDIWESLINIEHRMFTVMDTEMRILHHTIPHKQPMIGCPDCFKAFKESDERQSDKPVDIEDLK